MVWKCYTLYRTIIHSLVLYKEDIVSTLLKDRGSEDHQKVMTSGKDNVRNPFTGQMGNPNASQDEDSATIHKMTTTGVCVLDPTRTMSLIPAILVG